MRLAILCLIFILVKGSDVMSQDCDNGQFLVSGMVQCIGSCADWRQSISSIKVVSNDLELRSLKPGNDNKFKICVNLPKDNNRILLQVQFVEPKQYDISLEEEENLKRRSLNGQVLISVKSIFDIIQGSFAIAESKSSKKDKIEYLERLEARDYIWTVAQKQRLAKMKFETQTKSRDFNGSNKTIQSFIESDSSDQDFLFSIKYEMSKNYLLLGDNENQLQVLLDIQDIPENKLKLYYKSTFDAFGELYKSKSGKPYSDLGLKEFIETEPSLKEKWEEFYFKWSEINKVNEMSELLSQIEKMRTSFRYD